VALIQTVDFFTPVVDDPYWFGQIAAANALSDVYAMGGIPKTAMNLVAFPAKTMDLAILRQIIQGGVDKLREAEVALIGGHSIADQEIKYGLSVTGTVRPERVLAKKGLRPGDRLVLTKPLGTGIVNTAIKASMATPDLIERATRIMATLNRTAAQVMADFDVGACTDITGFGLLGHLAEMVIGSGCGVHLNAARVPIIEEALAFAAMGLIPAGAYQNKAFREAMIDLSEAVARERQDILFDPQTSGGLLIAVRKNQADALLAALIEAGIADAAAIGTVIAGPEEKIKVV
jgi:selenide, water dikinase